MEAENIITLPLKRILVFCPEGTNMDSLALNIIYGHKTLLENVSMVQAYIGLT